MLLYDVPGQSVLLGPLRDNNGNPVTVGASIYVDIDGSPMPGAGTLAHWRNGTWRYEPTQAETNRKTVFLQLEGPSAKPCYSEFDTAGYASPHMGTFTEVVSNGGQLGANAPAGVNFTGQTIRLYDGPGKGQTATIFNHDPNSRIFLIARPWAVLPTTATRYEIDLDLFANVADYRQGQILAGGSDWVEFASNIPELASGDWYVVIRTGASAANIRLVTAYDPTTHRATVSPPWPAAPGNGDYYALQSGARSRLSADGLDTISTVAPTGPAANFREMVVQTWRRFFKKTTKTDTHIRTYADDNTTVTTSQPISSVGTDQTQGAAT